MNLSKSKYCDAVQCNKLLWLEEHLPDQKKEVSNQSTLDNGTEVGKVAKDLFGKHIDIAFQEDLQRMIEDTKQALKHDNVVITEASFFYQDNFCSVDILVKNNHDIEIYEVKSSTEMKDIYLDDIAYQVYILLHLGYSIKKATIVYLNSNYVRKGELELTKLFHMEEVLDIVLRKQEEVKRKIGEIDSCINQQKELEQEIGMHCVHPYECPYFEYCTRNLPVNNIFQMRGMQNRSKFKFYQQGIYLYQDLLQEDISWKLKQQIEFELYDKRPIVNKEKIKEFLNTLSYPLYFLDFETFQQPIPMYDGVKPYMQIPFQYSLHYIEKENLDLKHQEFLAAADMDPRRSLAEQLVKDIPLNVCVLAYNMSFEKTIIKNLAYLYPDLSNHLMNIHDHIQDLMIPFYNRDYYTKDMHGSYSIKYVLPALFPNEPSLNYHNLDMIHNGSEAMNSYANLKTLSEEEQILVRKNLLKYCGLDTYAMVKIWEKLKQVVDE